MCWSCTAACTATAAWNAAGSMALRLCWAHRGVPRCACGGVIKPEVVLYEEMLDEAVLQASVHAIAGANLLIVGGTSLNVYPAAGLLRYYAGREPGGGEQNAHPGR